MSYEVDSFGEESAFFKLRVALVLPRSVSTVGTWPVCFCKNLAKVSVYSRYKRANCHLTVKRMWAGVR